MAYSPVKASAAEQRRHLIDVIDRVKRALVLDLDGRLVSDTPVDTGRAHSGWNVSANEPDLSAPPDRLVPAPRNISPSTDPGTDYYVTNNVEYISALNDGHSKKAPAGFVEAAVATTTEFGQKIVRAMDL